MRIDSYPQFRRDDAVRAAWTADPMRVRRRDFLPERLAPEPVARGTDAAVCKLASLIAEADWNNWGIAFDAFGGDRPMFRSDWPVWLPEGSYHRVKELVADFVRGRREAERAKIFGDTAARFCGLNVRHGLTT